MEMQNRLSPSVSSAAETTDCEGGGGDAVTGLLGRLQRLKCRRRTTTCVRALLAAAHCTAAHVANWVIGHASGL